MKLRLFISAAAVFLSSLYVLLPGASMASELEAILTASDGSGELQSFHSLSIDVDRMVASAVNADDGIGAVYVYERYGNEWVETAKLTASDAAGLVQFGSGGVSLVGTRVIVGVPNLGSVYIYDLVDGFWIETKLADNNIGRTVSLDGDRAIVGHWGRTDPESGSAFIYELIDGSWVRTAVLPGFSLDTALDGDTAVVTSRRPDPDSRGGHNHHNYGVATVFELRSGEWVETATLITNDVTASFYGSSISLSENRLMVGASGLTRAGVNHGALYVYVRNSSGEWVESAKLTASDRSAGDGFGSHVSLNAGRAIVSKSNNTAIGGAPIPATYVFELTGDQWIETQMLLGRGEISVNGDTAIVVAERLAREAHVYNLGLLNNCDYSNASIHDGFGLDTVTNTSCDPLANEIAVDEVLSVADNLDGMGTTDGSTDVQPIPGLAEDTPNDSTDDSDAGATAANNENIVIENEEAVSNTQDDSSSTDLVLSDESASQSGGGSFWLSFLMFTLAFRRPMLAVRKLN